MRMLIKNLLLSVFFLSAWALTAQDFSKEEVTQKLDGLSDKDKVEFVIKNFYKLYSADFDNTIALANEAVSLSRKHQWKDLEGKSQVCLGVVYFLKGDYENALPKYNRAIDLFDSLHHQEGQGRLDDHHELQVTHQITAKRHHIQNAATYSNSRIMNQFF